MKQLVALTVLLTGIYSSQAQNFTANLTTAQAGGGGRTGSGTATFTLGGDGNDLSFNISYSGLSANVNNAHFHGPLPGTGVVFSLQPFGAFGATSGTFIGTWADMTGPQLTALNAGQYYINIHSVGQFAGGEIAGTVTAVPEPSTYALMAAAGGLALAMRRRKVS